MPKPSRHPNHPVRVLRKLLGFSSANAFAQFTGIPAETIRNLEQGRRAVTERVAMQIGIATGVLPSWLATGNIARGRPVNLNYEPLSKQEFEKFRGLRAKIDVDPNDGGDAEQIENYCHEAAIFLRAAARRGRLNQCGFFLRMAFQDAEKQLGLTKLVRRERVSELNFRFRSSNKLRWLNFSSAWKLLSPTAKFRWDAELAEKDHPKSSKLMEEIDNLREVVGASFDLPKRSKLAMRKPGSYSRQHHKTIISSRKRRSSRPRKRRKA